MYIERRIPKATEKGEFNPPEIPWEATKNKFFICMLILFGVS
jgi:hypothetical protein